MKNLTKHVQSSNHLHGLWARGDKIVVGVSGGRDSMCLLHVLKRIASKEELDLVVAHVNYGLRGADSDRDQQLVEDLCSEHGIECETLVLDISNQGRNENQWRNIRRAFFAKVARDHDAQSIALGHHKEDHAETLLLHLLRGAGLQGLSNMTFRSLQTMDSLGKGKTVSPLLIIRPLLDVDRSDITHFCTNFDVHYGEDETNTDTQLLRNRIRHELIPYLKDHYHQGITDVLARNAQIISEDYTYLSESVSIPLEQYDGAVSFSRDAFLQLPTSAQRFFLRSVLDTLLPEGSHGGFGLIEEFRKTLRSTKNKIQVIRTKDLIFTVKNATVEITLAS